MTTLEDVIDSLPTDTYFAVCTEIRETDFSDAGQDNYQPDTRTYFEDVSTDEFVPGLIAAGVALAFALVLWIGSCCVCCLSPRPLPQLSEFGKIHNGTWWKRVLSFALVGVILGLSAVVIAMSAWGIYETEDKVKVVVPRSFRLFEDTQTELENIDGNLTAVVDTGNELVDFIDRVIPRIENGDIQQLSQIPPALLDEFQDRKDEVEDAIRKILDVLQDEVRVYQDKINDAIGYKDESEGAEKGLRAILITSFLLMILFSLFVSIHAIFGRKPRWTICAAVSMWTLLILAFVFGVGFVGVARNIAEDSCLYMDEFSIDKVKEALDNQEIDERVAALLRYYYVDPEGPTIPLTALQILWDIPLDAISQFLSDFGPLIVNPDGTLAIDRTSLDTATQKDLDSAQEILNGATSAVASVSLIISGVTWRILHKDLKDLVCCTVFDAVDGIWVAWVVTSVAASLLALSVTYQVVKSIWMAGPPTKPIETRSVGPVGSVYATVDSDKAASG